MIDYGTDRHKALMLAPVSIVSEYRNRGIGSVLIKHSLKAASDKGYNAVFLVGYPVYYTRFGFKPASKYGITDTHDIPDEYIMALELEEGALSRGGGSINLG